jgi:hypothetical protein
LPGTINIVLSVPFISLSKTVIILGLLESNYNQKELVTSISISVRKVSNSKAGNQRDKGRGVGGGNRVRIELQKNRQTSLQGVDSSL